MQLRQTLLDFAQRRGEAKTFCPSEVARALYPEDWRTHMDEVRAEAQRLADAGRLRITQFGKPVHIDTVRGHIRLSIGKAHP